MSANPPYRRRSRRNTEANRARQQQVGIDELIRIAQSAAPTIPILLIGPPTASSPANQFVSAQPNGHIDVSDNHRQRLPSSVVQPASDTRRRHSDTRSRRKVASSTVPAYGAAAGMLLSALILAHSVSAAHDHASLLLAAILGLGATTIAVWWFNSRATGPTCSRSAGLTKSLLAQLTPVVCLSIAYPMAGHRLETARVGSVSLSTLVLAGSLITPWLSQTVCSPLYKVLSASSPADQTASLHSRWLAAWPLAAGAALLIATLFGFTTGTLLGWDRRTSCALAALCGLNALLSQSMVVAIMQHNYLSWAAAWAAYAFALVAMPTWWFLPPMAGLLTQLGYLAARRPAVLRPTFNRTLIYDLAKGFLIGAVLWSDKLFFFLKEPLRFHALLVFLAILPAIVSYGYYFVRLAPSLDLLVAEMRTTMERDPLARSAIRLTELVRQAELSITKATCTASALCLASVTIVSIVTPSVSMLYAAMAVASTNFLVITIFLYKLDYVGRTDLVYWFAGAHFLLVSLVFFFASPGVMTYLTLSALSVLITLLVARSALSAWRAPEYSFFWRYATSW